MSVTEAQRRAVKAHQDRMVEQGWKKVTFWLRPSLDAALDAFARGMNISRQAAFDRAISALHRAKVEIPACRRQGSPEPDIEAIAHRVAQRWIQATSRNSAQGQGMLAGSLARNLRSYWDLCAEGHFRLLPSDEELEALAELLALTGGGSLPHADEPRITAKNYNHWGDAAHHLPQRLANLAPRYLGTLA